MSLTKKQILLSQDFKLKEIEVPEWGGSVFLKTLNARELLAYEDATEKVGPSLYLTFSLVDETGKPLFSAKDVAELNEKDGYVLMRLFHESLALNKMDAASDEEREKKS